LTAAQTEDSSDTVVRAFEMGCEKLFCNPEV